jgi:hypothetical protein
VFDLNVSYPGPRSTPIRPPYLKNETQCHTAAEIKALQPCLDNQCK